MILYNRIERDYWNNEKVNQLFNTLKLKTDEQKIVRNLIEESEYLDKSLWTNIQVLYNPYDSNNDSNISFASIIINNVNNDDEEFNVLIFYSFFFWKNISNICFNIVIYIYFIIVYLRLYILLFNRE